MKRATDAPQSTDLSPLPLGWKWARLEEIAADEPNAITDGPFGSKLKTVHYTESGPRVVRLQNIGDGEFVDARAHISDDHFAALKKHCVGPNDLLVAALGESLPRSCIAPETLGPAIVKADCIRVRVRHDVSVRYVNFALSNEGTRRRVAKIVHGVGRPRLNLSEIKSITIPLPPLAEQQRIVAEIEKQLTRLEAGVAALRRAQASFKRYRAAVLKSACEGRLVPTEAALARCEGREYEDGGQLLAATLARRCPKAPAGGRLERRTRRSEPIGPDVVGSGDLPEGWSWSSIDQISNHLTSGSRDWSRFYGRGSSTFILAQNVRPMRLDLSERQLVDPPIGDAETERTRVQGDDLLVTIVGANTGQVCRVRSDVADHYVCQSVGLVRFVAPAIAKFAEIYLASPENGQAHWKRYIYGQGRPHLSFEQLRMTPIPLPPLAEQHRIVAEVERRLSVVEELETAVAANLARAARLRQAILKRAFSGELVPPEPCAG